MARSCANCWYKHYDNWGFMELCGHLEYELSLDEEKSLREIAEKCERYREYKDDDDEEYTPSATHGDYSPSNPWDAPGMSISDFI